MELIQTVLTVVVVLIVLYFIINWLFSKSSQLTRMANGNEKQTILASTIGNNSNSSNYTYSTWFYVNDWNYRFGEPKVLLGRLDDDNNASPSIVFDAMENNITISVSCYPQSQSTGVTGNKSIVHQCNVKNFPLQKWVNLIISLYGRTLDVYIDGKLVRTCVLPGVAKVSTKSDIVVTPNGGFNGWTSNFMYWDQSTNPQEAYNIYKGGFGGSLLGNMFNKYRIKFSFLTDNKEVSSIEI
jgi:hypothetical protein